MISKVIHLVMKQRILVLFILFIIFFLGTIAYKKINIDAFPDLTNNQVQILSKAEGYSPLEMEKYVSYPLEVEMSSLPGLIEKRSISQFALSSITLVFEENIDIYWIRNQILERIIRAKEKLPEIVETEMAPVSSGLGEIYQYSLESDSLTAMELRTIQDWLIVPQLRTVKGVVEVNSFGGQLKQYQILLDQDRMGQYNVSLDEVYNSVINNNSNRGGNFIVRSSEQYVIRSRGIFESTKDIETVIVKRNDDVPVHISNIATVEKRAQVRYGAATSNGNGETVVGIVLMRKGESGRDVVEAVKEKMKQLRTALPPSLKINVYYDRTKLVNASVKTVMDALATGVFLVVLVLFLFLEKIKPAVIVALVLPFSLLISFIVMEIIDLSANLMSLGGLAIGLGMLVDASIVVVENINRHLKENHSLGKTDAIIHAVKEVGRPSSFAIFVVVAVFLPLLSLEGLEGKIFSPLAKSISIALFASLALAFTMAPVLSDIMIKSTETFQESKFFIKLEKYYRGLLDFTIKRGRTILIVCGVILLGAFGLFRSIGTEFVPTLEEGSIVVQAFRLPSISLEESVRSSKFIEDRIKKSPEVLDVVSRTGRPELANDPMLPSISDIYVNLKEPGEWREGFEKADIVNEIRENLEELPGIAFSFTQPIALRVDELISGTKSQLAVKIFGNDMAILNEKAEEIASILKKMIGAVDIKVEQTTGFGYLQIKIKREKIASYGLNINDIQNYVEIAIGGKTAGRFYEGEKFFDIVLRYRKDQRQNRDDIKNIRVKTKSDGLVPLSTFADIFYEEGPAQISRDNGMRRISVEFNLEDIDIGSFVEAAKKEISTKLNLARGYFIEWGGQFKNKERAMERLSIIIPVTLLIVFVLLYTSMNSAAHAILVFFNIPFSIIGGIFALFLSGLYMSVPATVGFLAVIGTAVQNGIVLVSFIKGLSEKKKTGAIISGAVLRLKPILMTASTTLLGLLPLLLATGIGSEVQRPLAIVVVGSMFSSVFSTLFILPVLYERFIQKA